MRFPVAMLAGNVALAWCAACGDNADLEVRGAHQTYVVSRQSIPVTNTEARELGMDINGDGTVDNQTGMVLSTFHSYGLDTQEFTDRLIDRGSLIQLIDVQIPGPRDLPAAAGLATWSAAIRDRSRARASTTRSVENTCKAMACSISIRARSSTRRFPSSRKAPIGSVKAVRCRS